MQKIDLINNSIKTFFINMYIFYAYIKILNYKSLKFQKIVVVLAVNIILSIIVSIISIWTNYVTAFLLVYFVYDIILAIVMKNKLGYSTIITTIAFILTYATYIISILFIGNIIFFLDINMNMNSIIINVLIQTIQSVIILEIFKIKRIKNGLKFIDKYNNKEEKYTYIILSGGIILTVCGILRGSENVWINTLMLAGAILILLSAIIWIQNNITKHYKKNMRDRTISVQKAEIDEQTKLLEEVKAENLKLATAVHKYNHRLSSLELAMKSAISHNLNTEFADELSVMLKDTEDLSNSFAKECDVAKCILPLTNVPSIDNMFKYMQDEASKCNINFDLKINESINDLIDNIIPKDMFETLLGDHLRDAIIAVNASDNSYKSILTTLGLVDGCYELSVYDTGIEFQIDTLLKLGKEQVTTHKDSGGSGIGFMTTFETLKTTKASLVIEEYSPETTNYTKSVSIRFDGKNQYRIYSYRADDIKKQNKEKRIIIKNIE